MNIGNREPIDGGISQLANLIEKEFGKNTLYQPSKFEPVFHSSRISTGNPLIDYDLGGGIPLGRIILVSGPWSSGKTFFVSKCIAEFTKLKARAAILDEERTIDSSWLTKCGVDMDYVWKGAGEYSEQSLDLFELLTASGEFDVLLLDSLAAMLPKKMRDDAHEDQHMGLEAKLNAKLFRKLLAAQDTLEKKGKTPPTIFVINQWRKKMTMFGNPNVLPGGEAQYFYPSIWLDFRIDQEILDENDLVVGQNIKYDIPKNKTAPPRRKGVVSMYNNDFMGMSAGNWDVYSALIDLGIKAQVFTKEGKWYKSDLFAKAFMFKQLWKELASNLELQKAILDKIHENSNVSIPYQPMTININDPVEDTTELVVDGEIVSNMEENSEEEEPKKKGRKKKVEST